MGRSNPLDDRMGVSCVDGFRPARVLRVCKCCQLPSCVRGLWMRRDMAAGSDGNVDRDLIIAAGWQCPDDPLWLPSIAGLTGIAITHVHPRKLRAAVAVSGSSRQRPAAEVLLARHQRPADA